MQICVHSSQNNYERFDAIERMPDESDLLLDRLMLQVSPINFFANFKICNVIFSLIFM